MKWLARLLLSLGGLYIVFWAFAALYFSYATSHKGLLESELSKTFKRDVSIRHVDTEWRGWTPRIRLSGLEVAGDTENLPALAFDSLSATIAPGSILRLWPQFTEFAVEKPQLEIVSLENGQIQVAGVPISSDNRSRVGSQRLLSWLMDQHGGVWHDGLIVWRREGGGERRYENISFLYQRTEQTRTIEAAVVTDKGPLAFTATAQGNVLADSEWDASLEVLGEDGQRLLKSQDLSLTVEDGQGRVQLKTLDVERIRDFVRLAGLASAAGWLIEAEVDGRLHDVEFEFSGPLLNVDSWALKASASNVGFKSARSAPAMNNLSGELQASSEGGLFKFATENAQFTWSRWFDRSFPVTRASGEVTWNIDARGDITVSLTDGELHDATASIGSINARGRLDSSRGRVRSFGELFKVDSVADLSFEDGEVVSVPSDALPGPLTVNATAQFEFSDMSRLSDYLPNDKRIGLFRSWASKAFVAGQVSNGRISYNGEVSRNAFRVGKAQLDATAQFDNVTVDYGAQRNWPAVKNARGSASLRNELLTITPEEVWLNGDPVTDSQLQISNLLQRDRLLMVEGKTSTSLVKGMDFLFKGPLILPKNRLDVLPIIAKKGRVDIETAVEIPLNSLNDARVSGRAQIRNGRGLLPEGIPIDKLSATVDFTEKSVSSNNIKARFLGGETRGKLETVKEAQPPVMKLSADGIANMRTLEPWIGEHMLTWFEGTAPWQGELLIDGGKIDIKGVSNLEGVAINAPAPLSKKASDSARMSLSMTVGGNAVQQALSINYQDNMAVRFKANKRRRGNRSSQPSLFDNSMISIGSGSRIALKPGVNFLIQEDQINLDDWLSAIIDLASYKPKKPGNNTDFLDAMRSVELRTRNPILLGRRFGPMAMSIDSVDGSNWSGRVEGENIQGDLSLSPRSNIGKYDFKLKRLELPEAPKSAAPPEPVDYGLRPQGYPQISMQVETFRASGKNLGRLLFVGAPVDQEWVVDTFTLKHNGIGTVARGKWVNDKGSGSISSFDFATVIDEAEGALTELDFDGIIKKGEGSIEGNMNWIGAPHEFDYARLNGEFDLRLNDGELVQVEPGSGKLLGLLNFNAIARRLVFDFRDVFASGLQFDRMRYTGVLADGEAIFKEAYILTPAVFVRMEGKLDLDKELIDLEVHLSPELGGNLALLSALANPTAGAVVFITQRLFKDEMRESNFRSYRARGTWKDFEMVEIEESGTNEPVSGDVSDADVRAKTLAAIELNKKPDAASNNNRSRKSRADDARQTPQANDRKRD